jgi:ParB-like chromosome segregation protein Spo0J
MSQDQFISDVAGDLALYLECLDLDAKVAALNQLKLAMHAVSPMAAEPVDCVLWVKLDEVQANDYNPNAVAPPEMELLHTSILQDGFTQPIVAWESAPGAFTVVDGFHRNRVGKEREDVRERIHGYLPVTVINHGREDLGDRMVSTIRHNRARGKHNVDSMSDIVVELKRRNWSDDRISRNLGMQADEILRLCQISGLTEMFADAGFSTAWEVGTDGVPTDDIEALLLEPVDEDGEAIACDD